MSPSAPSGTPLVGVRPATLSKPATPIMPKYKGFIQISVGEGDELLTFTVHEDIITARSLFFKKALSGNWKEAEDRMVKLPEDDPMTFRRYVHLLYTNALTVQLEQVSDPYGYVHLGRLYVLAEKIQDIKTKNAVIEAVLLATRQKRIDGRCYYPGIGIISLIYAGTGPRSPMRKLLVDLYTDQGLSEWLMRACHEWPSDFTRELAIQLLDQRARLTDVPTSTGNASSYMEVNDVVRDLE